MYVCANTFQMLNVCFFFPLSVEAGEKQGTTHFGFQTVDAEEKQGKVAEVFHRVAENYDVMNDLMSAGVHRVWKEHFVASLNPQPGMRLLDVAGGTGGCRVLVCEALRPAIYHWPSPHS